MSSFQKSVSPSRNNLNESKNSNNLLKEALTNNEYTSAKHKDPFTATLSKKIRDSLNHSATSSRRGSLNNSRMSIFQPIPTLVRNDNIIMGPETYKSFIRPSRNQEELLLELDAMKVKPQLHRGNTKFTKISEKKKDELKTRKKSGGKMFINELWGKKHYQEIIKSTLIKAQDDEMKKLQFQSTEEKAEIAENYVYTRYFTNKDLTDKIINKYKLRESVLKQDSPGYTESIVDSFPMTTEATPKSSGAKIKHNSYMNRFKTPSPKNYYKVPSIKIDCVSPPRERMLDDNHLSVQNLPFLSINNPFQCYNDILDRSPLQRSKSPFSMLDRQKSLSPIPKVVDIINPTSQIYQDVSNQSAPFSKIDSKLPNSPETKRELLLADKRLRNSVNVKIIERPNLTEIKSLTHKSLGEIKSPKRMNTNHRVGGHYIEGETRASKSGLVLNQSKQNSILSITDANSPNNIIKLSVHSIIEMCNIAKHRDGIDGDSSSSKLTRLDKHLKLIKRADRSNKEIFIKNYNNVLEEKRRRLETIS